MSMELAALLDADLVLTDMDAGDSTEAIRRLGELLYRRGYVDEGFVDAALAREAKYPTGLATEGIQVALPHAEIEYVRTSKVAIGVLRHPIVFQRMDEPERSVEAKAIFMLAISDAKAQVLALQQLADLFQDGVTLRRIAAAPDSAQVCQEMLEGLEGLAARFSG